MNYFKCKRFVLSFIDRVHTIYKYDFDLFETPADFVIRTHSCALPHDLLALLPLGISRYMSFGVVDGYIELYIDKRYFSK